MSIHEAVAAISRARALATDLDRSDRPEDRRQVSAGVRHELDAALVSLRALLEAEHAGVGAPRPGKVRSDACGTSRAAAQAVAPRRGTQAWTILSAIADAHGLTDHEIQTRTGIDPSTERPRRGELVDDGYVRNTGNVRDHQGRGWTVWAVTERGADAVRSETGRPVAVLPEPGPPSLF